jgi:hypothetical protein
MGNGYHNSGYEGPDFTQPMVPQDFSDKEFYARFDARMREATEQGPASGQQGDTQSTFDHG